MLNNEVTVKDFSKALGDALKDYAGDVQRIVDEEIETESKEGVKRLKKTSPKERGDYAKGWKMRKKETRFGLEVTLYNSTHGWLVHLLENGHAKRNGGRVAAEPHVKPVQDWLEKEIIAKLKEKL